MISEVFVGFTDVFGGRSTKFEGHLHELQKQALSIIKRKAALKGANSIIGLRADIDEISGKGTMMIMATVSGTAVIAKKTTVTQETIMDGDVDVIAMEDVKKEIDIKEYCERLNASVPYETKKIIVELIESGLEIPIDIFIGFILSEKYYNSYIFSETKSLAIEYLNIYDRDIINNELNMRLDGYLGGNELFNEMYDLFAVVDYKKYVTMFDKYSIDILCDIICNSLLKYKEFYIPEDIDYIRGIIGKIKVLLDKSETEKYKGAISSGWICSFCKEKNAEKNEYCKKCGKGQNGFTEKQKETATKAISHLSKIEDILNEKFKKTDCKSSK